jgi:hypothetical protein
MTKISKTSFLPVLFLTFFLFSCTANAAFGLFPADREIRQFSFEIKPEASAQSAVVAENLTDKPVTIHLYAADGTQSNLGTFALTTPSTEQRHIGTWVTFKTPEVTLDPHEKREISFTIKVPTKVTPGVYAGGIAAESGAVQNSQPTEGSAVSVSSRIVIKLYVTIPGEKISQYSWDNFSYTSEDGRDGSFNLSFKNNGNTIIIAEQKIRITGFPAGARDIELPDATLLQGSNMDIPSKWDKEPFFGFYKATATVNFSELDVITNKKGTPQTVTKELSIFIPLKTETIEGKITIAVALALLILLIGVIVYYINKFLYFRKCSPYVVQQGDSLPSIAQQCGVRWKKIATVNKIKAPYNLKPGQYILASFPRKKK